MSQKLVDIRIRLCAERVRHNMAVEELMLFPAAEKSLGEEDSCSVERANSQTRPDPFFENEPDKQFAELFRVATAEKTTVSDEFSIQAHFHPTFASSGRSPVRSPIMSKKALSREQIRQEVQHRLQPGPSTLTGLAEIAIPMPHPHSLDVHARNWDMEEFGGTGHSGYVRKVVEEARKEFFLSDATERDELLGDSFAHR